MILELNIEHASSYEKTIIYLMCDYIFTFCENLKSNDWQELSLFLNIDFNVTEKILQAKHKVHDNVVVKINGEVIFPSKDYKRGFNDYKLFQCIVYYFFVISSIKSIDSSCSEISLNRNYDLYANIQHYIQMINVNSGVYECMKHGEFSKSHAPQSFETFSPNIIVDYLRMCIFYSEYFKKDNQILRLMCLNANYDIMSHAKAMFLIVVFQILNSSPFYEEATQYIADKLYRDMHFLLKDGRVTNIKVNYLYQDTNKNYQERNRNSDNTTRLEIIYGFDNFDIYNLRLDLSHKGINYTHYNNESQGGVKAYCFTEEEFDRQVLKYPSIESCFLRLGNRWFLKERSNCELSKQDEVLYNQIEKDNNHTIIFDRQIEEKELANYFESFNKLATILEYGYVEKDNRKTKLCFAIDQMMFRLNLLELDLCCNKGARSEKLINDIVEISLKHEIIGNSEKNEYLNLAGVKFLIELANEMAMNN